MECVFGAKTVGMFGHQYGELGKLPRQLSLSDHIATLFKFKTHRVRGHQPGGHQGTKSGTEGSHGLINDILPGRSLHGPLAVQSGSGVGEYFNDE